MAGRALGLWLFVNRSGASLEDEALRRWTTFARRMYDLPPIIREYSKLPARPYPFGRVRTAENNANANANGSLI
jgi:hypothetical protein